jgi:hypothetical protein
LASSPIVGTSADTTAEVQALVDAYNKILAEANGTTADATPADPTAADYAAIGAGIGSAATDAEALGLLNDAIGAQTSTGVDTVAEINALAATADKVMNAAAGDSPTPNDAELTALGITGVTAGNLAAILAAIAATANDGSGVGFVGRIAGLGRYGQWGGEYDYCLR